MRRTLVDRARYRQRIKRGGDRIVRHDLCGIELIAPEPEDELLHLNEALDALEASDPTKASVVKLKFYCGMTIEEISSAMNLSSATVERYWAYSRVWLQHWIERRDDPEENS
jgi:RNA polymerase sigma factor (TIGR02999 family)